MFASLKNKKIVIIGGSSGIGFAIAQLAVEQNADVLIASRHIDKLKKAQQRLNNAVEIEVIDLCNENDSANFFKKIGSFDHLQLPGSETLSGPFLKLPTADAKATFESKFWGAYNAVKFAVPNINKEGSITLFSGRLSQLPLKECAPLSAVNGAVEALGRALALELAPIRVNVLSPGLTKTELFTEKYAEEKLDSIFKFAISQNIIQRFAEPKEIALAAIYLMRSSYTTGSTLFIDGGCTFR